MKPKFYPEPEGVDVFRGLVYAVPVGLLIWVLIGLGIWWIFF